MLQYNLALDGPRTRRHRIRVGSSARPEDMAEKGEWASLFALPAAKHLNERLAGCQEGKGSVRRKSGLGESNHANGKTTGRREVARGRPGSPAGE
ncbi:MAG: hypothetical protein ACE5JI_09660 [Acidobacteriota bacterium]